MSSVRHKQYTLYHVRLPIETTEIIKHLLRNAVMILTELKKTKVMSVLSPHNYVSAFSRNIVRSRCHVVYRSHCIIFEAKIMTND